VNLTPELSSGDESRSVAKGKKNRPPRTHNVTLAILRAMSIRENLRLVYPDGKTRRAYWTNIDRTHARGEYSVDGKRVHVYGPVRDGRILCR